MGTRPFTPLLPLISSSNIYRFSGDPPYTLRPLLFHHDSKIIIQYARRSFTGFLGLPRSTSIPPLSEDQAEAWPKFSILSISSRRNTNWGSISSDIQYINNLSVFHARDGFVDTPEKTRHLLRLWLRNEELAWKLPEKLEPIWKRLYYSATSPDEHRFPVEPEIRAASKGYAT
ncbi:uncharacterized protein LACBIDRAFT_304456 [Laccaria bicolor S238N-H82]|uniref:Predicted protein n=1 Tax=Laccaria bicolor (strain S238N-H82 / ATCC MYA-4686) TaxID=486041 RepID=B0D926_LACBS|nr:uncharacterized protein LACBIDRAFT_296546 [Laccaria bicolor S238N-H82]XP_001884846.1 uncharacterized protein LACBIDRAFT_304456 [Laccaria bicolor S238N-H82]EDR04327.1 predicted protein [Laccaria bicolor S238N-H82]EDR09181.1 predicted protein [Laccaria bicolor S238N-H82]|eukprot:XP_001880494.1 predicted protein [Laccaria bicolor S238N-H82]